MNDVVILFIYQSQKLNEWMTAHKRPFAMKVYERDRSRCRHGPRPSQPLSTLDTEVAGAVHSAAVCTTHMRRFDGLIFISNKLHERFFVFALYDVASHLTLAHAMWTDSGLRLWW